MLTAASCQGAEIREQLERIADMSNIRGQFCTTITSHVWDEGLKRWIITMDHKTGPNAEPVKLTVQAQFLILGGGIQTSPHAPKLNGVSAFTQNPDKVLMHTARWDWYKSGGSQKKPDMTEFQGKRVGIVGTGATAVQVAPHVAKWAKETVVSQRTPSYVGPQRQEEVADESWKEISAKPGWQYDRMASLDASFTGAKQTNPLVRDGWAEVSGLVAMAGHAGDIVTPEEEEAHVKRMIVLDYPWTEAMRLRVDQEVHDKPTAQKLKAWYPASVRDLLSMANICPCSTAQTLHWSTRTVKALKRILKKGSWLAMLSSSWMFSCWRLVTLSAFLTQRPRQLSMHP